MYIVLLTLVLGFNVNSYLALFNLLPIPPLDGSKIVQWNLPIYLLALAFSGLLTYMSYTISFL
jgi:Zn-dependent protease